MTIEPAERRRRARAARARQRRVQGIRDGARVRETLGEAALHHVLRDGHEIVHRGERYTGATLAEALAAAQGTGGAEPEPQ